MLVLTLLLACQTTAPSLAPEPSEAPVRGGVIVEPILADIKTLQPVLAADVSSQRATDLIYEPLFDLDPRSGEERPRLGRWQVSADGRTYTWQITSDASWSDGKPIVAADVATTLRAYGKSWKTVHTMRVGGDIEGFDDFAAGRTEEISGLVLDQADPKRFSVRLVRSSCRVPLQLYPLPTHVFGKYVAAGSGDAIDRAPENDAPTVASGPFVLEDWRRGEHVKLARNPTYWRGAPHLDGYTFKVVPVDQWVAQLRSGKLSYVVIDGINRPALPELERGPQLRVHRTLADGYTYIGWNTQSQTAPALRDRRVRRALAYGFNGDLALQRIVGVGARNLSHHPAFHWAYPSGLHDYAFDPGRARKLIEEAGYSLGPDRYYQKDGRVLAFSMETNAGSPDREALLQLAVDQYREIGVRVTPVLRSFSELATRSTSSDEIEAWILGWGNLFASDPHNIWHSSQIPDPTASPRKVGFNASRLRVSGLDEALEAARNGPDCSIATRKKHYETFNRILNEEQPYHFGFVSATIRATPANLRGFQPSVHHDWSDVHRWWFAPTK